METVKISTPMHDFRQAFPSQSLETVVNHLLEAAIETELKKQKVSRAEEIREKFKKIRDASPHTSNDDIRALRDEGRT
jgi:ketosteroid isomerase-like protein